MVTVLELLPDLLVGALAGPLVMAGIAKLLAAPGSLGWPVDRGVLAVPYGPRIVGAAEVSVAAGLITVPGAAAAMLGAGAYATLAVAATALYGRTCACFGDTRLAAVSRRHVAMNALGAGTAVLAMVLPGGPSAARVARIAAAAVGAAVTGAVLRRRPTAPAAPPADCGRISAVRLYTTETCPSCQSLKVLVDAMEPARRELVSTTVLGPGETPPPPLTADLGVPAAYAVDAAGEPVCAPAAGIGAVKALIDSITIGSRAHHGQ